MGYYNYTEVLNNIYSELQNQNDILNNIENACYIVAAFLFMVLAFQIIRRFK